jgi:hypothetical protein
MSEPRSTAEAIETLARTLAKLEWGARWQILISALAAAVVGLSHIITSLRFDGRMALPHALSWGAMTMIALTGCFGATTLYRVWKKQNAKLVELYQRLQEAREALEGFKPLAEFVAEAHSQGAAAVIPPPFPGEDAAPKPPVLH